MSDESAATGLPWASEAAAEPWFSARLCRLIDMPVENLDLDTPLAEYGLDSILAMEFALELEAATDVNLGLSLFDEHITTRTLITIVFRQYDNHTGAPQG